jgi:IS605 OrfB family transposase
MTKEDEKSGARFQVKVLKLHILKPAVGMTWPELGKLLENTRYRVFRLANLVVSEAYLNFHRSRSGEEFDKQTIGKLNRKLREMLETESKAKDSSNNERFSKDGALPASVVDALSQYKLSGLTSKAKWSDVVRGKSSLPTFRLDMAIPIRCDKAGQRRLERAESGDVELDLQITLQPYPRVVIATKGKSLGDGQLAILDRLLDHKEGYEQRCLEVKKEKRSGKWHLFVTYRFPSADPNPHLSADRIVGADLGVSCPLYAAITYGHARLGRRQFAALGARIRSLQNRTIRHRREIQRGGNAALSKETARSGHGRNRKLQPIEKLDGRIGQAYTTLNHQLSAALVKFAKDNGAGVIQIEDLKGLGAELSGTFIGERWRYEELQRFIAYKAKESGIELRKVNPRYTSRRCSNCGHIDLEFDRKHRDAAGRPGKSARFHCPECDYFADADYNAARNLATADIDKIIAEQEARQKPADNAL